MPMGGAVGSQFDVTISGDFLDDVTALTFSDPRITAAPKLTAEGKPEPNRFVVKVDCPVPRRRLRRARHDTARLSSSRAFSVGTLAGSRAHDSEHHAGHGDGTEGQLGLQCDGRPAKRRSLCV